MHLRLLHLGLVCQSFEENESLIECDTEIGECGIAVVPA